MARQNETGWLGAHVKEKICVTSWELQKIDWGERKELKLTGLTGQISTDLGFSFRG